MNWIGLLKNFFAKKQITIPLKTEKVLPQEEALLLWEDDYLMIEFLPAENIDFVKKEVALINGFAEQHFDGFVFTNITVKQESPIKTCDRLIKISDLEGIMRKAGLERITKIRLQDVGIMEKEKTPFAFGTTDYGIICEQQNGILQNLWATGHIPGVEHQEKLIDATMNLGKEFNLIAVNWYIAECFDIKSPTLAQKFVEASL